MSNNWQPNNSYEKKEVEYYQTGIVKKRIETYKTNGNLHKRTTSYAPDGYMIHSAYETVSLNQNLSNNYYINIYETRNNNRISPYTQYYSNPFSGPIVKHKF